MRDRERPLDEKGKVIRVRLDGRNLLLILAIASILIGGAALRIHSLAYTPYPYLLDGLGEAQYAEHIAETGAMAPEAGAAYSSTHTVNTPAYDAFIALFSLVEGGQPLFLLQKLVAAFSVLLLVGSFVFIRRLSGSNRVSLMALMALASYGSFLMVTQSTWKEGIGLSIAPLIFVTFMLREDRRMRAISTLLIFFIPFVHHMIAIVVVMTIAFIVFNEFLTARRMKVLASGHVFDALVTIVAVDEMALYYTFVRFDRLDYLTPDNGLYLFIGLAILMALGVNYISDKGLTQAGKKAMIGVASVGLIALLAMNILAPIGTTDFNVVWAVSVPMLACIVIVLAAIVGISIWASVQSPHKNIFFALIASPFILITYGLLRGEDIISLDMITRSLDLLDFAVMIGLGTVLIYILKRRPVLQVYGAVSAVCILLLASMPIAFDSERYAATRNDIFSYEIDGINWTASVLESGEIQTDTLFTYTSYLFNVVNDPTLVRRLAGTLELESDKWMIASESWTTKGVKDLPYGWVVLDPALFQSKLDSCNVFYLGGPQGSQLIVFRLP